MNDPNELAARLVVREFNKTNVTAWMMYAGGFLMGAIVPWYALNYMLTNGQPLALVAIPALWLLTAVMMRALENLVHDASHYNIFRSNKTVNDVIGTLMAAAAVGNLLSAYRPVHNKHHKDVGGETDPCKDRAVMAIGGATGDADRWAIIVFATTHLLELNMEFYSSMFQKRATGFYHFLAWHILVMIVPAVVMNGLSGVALWFVYWMIPMTALLPIIRAVAERWEHDYNVARDGMVKTYSNLGFIDRLIFHPAGDAYHAAHHAYPYVPAYRMRRLHEFLVAHEQRFNENPVRH